MTNVYRVLSDPIRREMIRMLAQQCHTQSEIVDAFDVSQPAITKHLKILKEEGFVTESKQGRYRIYQLDRENAAAAYQNLLDDMDRLLGTTLEDLKEYVEAKEEKDG